MSQIMFRIEAFSSLRNRDFRLLWSGIFLSMNGMQMQIVARGWLVYTMTESALALGLVAAGMGAPLVLFSMFGGAVADRVPKRNLILAAQSGLTLINLVITILIISQKIALWHLVASSFLTGTIFAFSMPTRQAFIVELVGQESLTNAIALNSMAQNICRIASPALGGVLLKVIGIPGVYCIVSVSYALVVLTLTMIPSGGFSTPEPGRNILHDITAGLRYMAGNKNLLTLLLIAFVPIIVATPYNTLMPVFAKTIFKAGETGLGLLMSAGGIGALCGSAIIATLGDYQRKGKLALICGSVFGISLVSFGISKSLPTAFVFLLFVGAGGSMYMTLITTLIMGNTPQELLGRVMSIFVMTFGLMPLAMLPAGALAQIIGAPAVVSGGGAVLFIFLIAIHLINRDISRLK
jgi:MFS family permease